MEAKCRSRAAKFQPASTGKFVRLDSEARFRYRAFPCDGARQGLQSYPVENLSRLPSRKHVLKTARKPDELSFMAEVFPS